jgi:hypothetical protein
MLFHGARSSVLDDERSDGRNLGIGGIDTLKGAVIGSPLVGGDVADGITVAEIEEFDVGIRRQDQRQASTDWIDGGY